MASSLVFSSPSSSSSSSSSSLFSRSALSRGSFVSKEQRFIRLSSRNSVSVKTICSDELVAASPDAGSVARARAFAKNLSDAPLAIVDKRRHGNNVAEVMNLIGEVKGKVTVMVDNMIDTAELRWNLLTTKNTKNTNRPLTLICASSFGAIAWLSSAPVAHSREDIQFNSVYEIGELFELGIQLSYLLLLLGLLAAGTFFVIRQVLVRRELDLSAKELQEQVRSGDADATELFELGAVMLRRKFYPAATKYLRQAINKWDGDDQDLAQVYNALGVSYVRDEKLDEGIAQFETAVKIQPGYVTAWNNLGDAYEKRKDLKAALKAFEEVLLFDPNNKLARPRRDALKERVKMYKGVPIKAKKG